MNKNFDTIIWSSDSENDLDDIEEYYIRVSPEKSTQKIIDIILKVEETIFSEQWQVDEFDSSS